MPISVLPYKIIATRFGSLVMTTTSTDWRWDDGPDAKRRSIVYLASQGGAVVKIFNATGGLRPGKHSYVAKVNLKAEFAEIRSIINKIHPLETFLSTHYSTYNPQAKGEWARQEAELQDAKARVAAEAAAKIDDALEAYESAPAPKPPLWRRTWNKAKGVFA